MTPLILIKYSKWQKGNLEIFKPKITFLLFFFLSNLHQNDLSHLALLVKFSVDDSLKYFSNFSQETGFDILCKLSPQESICIKCQIMFYLKKKKEKTTINLSSDEYAHRVKVKVFHFLYNLNQCCLAL